MENPPRHSSLLRREDERTDTKIQPGHEIDVGEYIERP